MGYDGMICGEIPFFLRDSPWIQQPYYIYIYIYIYISYIRYDISYIRYNILYIRYNILYIRYNISYIIYHISYIIYYISYIIYYILYIIYYISYFYHKPYIVPPGAPPFHIDLSLNAVDPSGGTDQRRCHPPCLAHPVGGQCHHSTGRTDQGSSRWLMTNIILEVSYVMRSWDYLQINTVLADITGSMMISNLNYRRFTLW